MRDLGLSAALEKAGGVKALAQSLGVSQPAISMWKRVPADRVAAVEALTGVSRAALRPDLFQLGPMPDLDETEEARALEYMLLARLLWRAPDAGLLRQLAKIRGDATPLGLAHVALSSAAREANADAVQREFFNLFIGLGRGELLPYASFYLTGFLHEKPLANVRRDLAEIGVVRDGRVVEPEDHVAVLCETMAYLIRGGASNGEVAPITQKLFFERHLQPWAGRFFADLEAAESPAFYRPIGVIGRCFMDIEIEAFALPA